MALLQLKADSAIFDDQLDYQKEVRATSIIIAILPTAIETSRHVFGHPTLGKSVINNSERRSTKFASYLERCMSSVRTAATQQNSALRHPDQYVTLKLRENELVYSICLFVFVCFCYCFYNSSARSHMEYK